MGRERKIGIHVAKSAEGFLDVVAVDVQDGQRVPLVLQTSAGGASPGAVFSVNGDERVLQQGIFDHRRIVASIFNLIELRDSQIFSDGQKIAEQLHA